MIVFILEKVPESLRGELTRWMLEPKTGVFLGILSAAVREKLWEKIIDALRADSGALLAYHDPNTDWGFHLRVHGNLNRRLIERDGLQLIQRDHPDREKAHRKLNTTIPHRLRSELATKLGVPIPEPSTKPENPA